MCLSQVFCLRKSRRYWCSGPLQKDASMMCKIWKHRTIQEITCIILLQTAIKFLCFNPKIIQQIIQMTEEWWTALRNWPALSLTELFSPKEKQSMDLPGFFTDIGCFHSKTRRQSACGGHWGKSNGNEAIAMQGFGLCIAGEARLSQRMYDFEPDKSCTQSEKSKPSQQCHCCIVYTAEIII